MTLARADRAQRLLRDMAGRMSGSIHIHASQTSANYWLPSRLIRFLRKYPGIDADVTIGNSAQVVEALKNGSADIGLAEGAVNERGLRQDKVADDTVVIVVGPQHPWVDAPPTSWEGLLESGWVLREPGSGTRSTFDDALSSQGVDPAALRVAMQLPSNEAILTVVIEGELASALSLFVVRDAISAGRLHRIQHQLPGRKFLLLRRAGQDLNRAAELIVDGFLGWLA